MNSQALDNAWSAAAAADLMVAENDLFFNSDNFDNFDFADLTNVENGAPQDHSQQQFAAGLAQSHHHQSIPTSTDIAGLGHDFLDFSIHTPYSAAPSNQHAVQSPFSLPEAMQFQQARSMVPPTPNSAELHANVQHYLSNRQMMMEQQNQYIRKDMGTFTPLVSPVMDGLNQNHASPFPMYNQVQAAQLQQHLNTPTAATPANFLSPIDSPILDPQLRQSQPFQFQEIAQASHTTSPNDGDVDMLIGEAAMPTEETRKPKRKNTTRNAGRVKQSPIVKAQSARRKSNLSANIPPREVNELLDSLRGPQSATLLSRPLDSSTESTSMNSSESPESLSDIIMGPPPKPASALQSPNILPHAQHGPTPATPANFLLLKTKPQSASPLIRPGSSTSTPNTPAQVYSQPNDDSQLMLEDLTLPEAAAPPRPELARLETSINNCISPPDALTPRISVNSRAGTATAGPSPNINAMSPKNATPTSTKPKSTKGGRKRSAAGASSQLVSPALRPKISPSIAPMLPTSAGGNGSAMSPATPNQPNGAVNINASADYTTLLLASKSNYQNILDGTFAAVPGVSYPGQLTESLNSKRTSHKLAEQGRRNRINLALKELESLIGGNKAPAASSPGDDADKNGLGEKGNNSKAATVESAIEFIKGLQSQARERDEEIERLKAKLRRFEGESPKEIGLSNGAAEVETHAEETNGDVEAGNDEEKEK